MVDYSEESKVYRLLDQASGNIIISRDVKFIENERSNKKTEVPFDLDNNNKNNFIINSEFASELQKISDTTKSQ